MVTESLRLYSEFQANQGCRMKLGEKKKKEAGHLSKAPSFKSFHGGKSRRATVWQL